MFQSDFEKDENMVIGVVASGNGGIRAVKKMVKRIDDIDFFGILGEQAHMTEKIAIGSDVILSAVCPRHDREKLSSAMKHTDLEFVITYCEDKFAAYAASQMAESARLDGALVIGVTTLESRLNSAFGNFDSVLMITGKCIVPGYESIPLIFGFPSLVDYLMRHAIQTITSLITKRSLICIDYSDVKSILTDGGDNYMGIGVAGGTHKGRDAAANALKGLTSQGIDTSGVNGILACIMGSTNMSMEDFENAVRVLSEAIPEDANLICGMQMDDMLGNNIKVTAFANN